MGKERGFLEYQRNEAGYRPVVERVRDFRAVDLRLSEADLRDQAARCMDCGIPFCHGCGCPLENVIPEFNDHVY
ncbi:MAG: glutamate synthase, partial [Verrucomicrobia bacterium]|nr:glutamate synthase [Verrucomicrobiota bacterium]